MWDSVAVTQSSFVGDVEFSTEMSQSVADIMLDGHLVGTLGGTAFAQRRTIETLTLLSCWLFGIRGDK